MSTRRNGWRVVFVVTFMIVAVGLVNRVAWAHCDAVNGPVAIAARKALETSKFETVAIWVGKEQNDELRSSFEKSLPVYRMGGKSQELAERYFMETAVRLHRQAEGFPYTGLKPAQPLPPDVATAERALETGDLNPVSKLLSVEMEKKLRTLFQKVHETRKEADENIDAGREWVDAYVKYVIYVHSLYTIIQAGPKHGIGD